MATRKNGFGYLTGHFNAAVAVQYVDAALLHRLLPAGMELLDRGPAPEGTHPLLCFYANGIDIRWSPLPLASFGADVLALLIPGVRVASARYRGSFAYTLAWWAGNRWSERLGARIMGLPCRPERLEINTGKTEWSVRAADLIELDVTDSGAQPDWPKVRQLCPVVQQPLVAQRHGREPLAAGLHWNLGDADMRDCGIRTRISGKLLGGTPWQGHTEGTLAPDKGGALRMGALWTLTRGGDIRGEWGMWRSSPTLRLRADVSLSALDRAVRRPASGAVAAPSGDNAAPEDKATHDGSTPASDA